MLLLVWIRGLVFTGNITSTFKGENDDDNDDIDQYKRPEEYLLCRLLRWPSFFSMTYRGCNSYLFP